MHDTTRIALCGKGGVGKTSVAAMMVKILGRGKHRKVLAIDADPACGLAVALGVKVRKTVDDIRKDLISRVRKGEPRDARQTVRQLDYEMFDALHEQDGFAMLAIGRPEDEGCFCRVNALLKDILADLAGSFDVVVIDGEAGVEQINRRVMKTVDHLVIISDTSVKGIGVAGAIAHVARDNRAVDFRSMGLVLNRVRRPSEVDDIRTRTGLPIYGWVLEDDLIRDFDFRGESLAGLPDASPSLGVVEGILETMGLSPRGDA
jgi:CO dehydrogenase maturation factor